MKTFLTYLPIGGCLMGIAGSAIDHNWIALAWATMALICNAVIISQQKHIDLMSQWMFGP